MPPTPASPTSEAGIVRVDLLQRNPDPEEPEAPLVEPGIPEGCFVVAVVVNGTVPPWPAGWRKRPVPGRPWRLTRSPGRGPVSPRRTAEVAALRIAAPRTARSTGATRAAGSPRVVVPRSAWAARSARVIGPGSAWTARPTGPARVIGRGATWTARPAGSALVIGSTRSAWVARPAGSARVVRTGRRVEVARRRAAVVTAGSRRWRSRSGEC